MSKKLLLVDFENKQKVDLSPLDESYQAIVFVGANQNPPKASKKAATAYRFSRVDFLKISGAGKNALDYHIAFQLGRTFEATPDTYCFVLSGDKGFDPLLNHLNTNGISCKRMESIADFVRPNIVAVVVHDQVACSHCKKTSSIEYHGGLWSSNCGRFATPPEQKLLPSNAVTYQAAQEQRREYKGYQPSALMGSVVGITSRRT